MMQVPQLAARVANHAVAPVGALRVAPVAFVALAAAEALSRAPCLPSRRIRRGASGLCRGRDSRRCVAVARLASRLGRAPRVCGDLSPPSPSLSPSPGLPLSRVGFGVLVALTLVGVAATAAAATGSVAVNFEVHAIRVHSVVTTRAASALCCGSRCGVLPGARGGTCCPSVSGRREREHAGSAGQGPPRRRPRRHRHGSHRCGRRGVSAGGRQAPAEAVQAGRAVEGVERAHVQRAGTHGRRHGRRPQRRPRAPPTTNAAHCCKRG